MILEPNCSKRGCAHFLGVKQPKDSEFGEVAYCHAFPNGIPDEIAYGDNLHTTVQKGQVGAFVFEVS